MAKKTNANGGGTRVLNVRTTPPLTPPRGRGMEGSLGRVQFPPGFGGKPAGYDTSGPSTNPLLTGTLPTGLNTYTLHTRVYENTKAWAQVLAVFANFGDAWKQSGSPVMAGMTPLLAVDGVVMGPAGQEQFVDGGQLGMRVCFVPVKPGQKVTVTMQVSINMIASTTGAFAFSDPQLGLLALAAE